MKFFVFLFCLLIMGNMAAAQQQPQQPQPVQPQAPQPAQSPPTSPQSESPNVPVPPPQDPVVSQPPTPKGLISGCSFSGRTLFKGAESIATNWAHGFKVPTRTGSGILFKKIDPGPTDEAYLGEFEIDDRVKLIVETRGVNNELQVDAVIVRELENHTFEVIAEGSGRGKTSLPEAKYLSVSVDILNPLIATIRQNEGLTRDPMESRSFPLYTPIYAGALVTCYSDFK